jgi:hypothetical protein
MSGSVARRGALLACAAPVVALVRILSIFPLASAPERGVF